MKNIKHYRTGEQRKTTARQKEPQREDPPTAEDEALLQIIYYFKNAHIILSIEKEREKSRQSLLTKTHSSPASSRCTQQPAAEDATSEAAAKQ